MVTLLGGLLYRLADSPEWQARLNDAGSAFARAVVGPILDLIGKPAFVYTTSLLIIVAAFVACTTYWRRVLRPKVRDLQILRDEIGGLPPLDLHRELHRERAQTQAMRQLGELLRRKGLFVTAWAMFQSEAARSGRVPEAPFRHFAATDPSATEEEHRGFMHALPSYFTSVGLILTFVGLVVALYFAARGFRSGDLEEARTAINQLLNASAFKFLTSVAALGSALLISVFLRYCLSILRRETWMTLDRIDGYVSASRELEGIGGVASPMAEVAERLDLLLQAVTEQNQYLRRALNRSSETAALDEG